jgi:hypothetical protein
MIRLKVVREMFRAVRVRFCLRAGFHCTAVAGPRAFISHPADTKTALKGFTSTGKVVLPKMMTSIPKRKMMQFLVIHLIRKPYYSFLSNQTRSLLNFVLFLSIYS